MSDQKVDVIFLFDSKDVKMAETYVAELKGRLLNFNNIKIIDVGAVNLSFKQRLLQVLETNNDFTCIVCSGDFHCDLCGFIDLMAAKHILWETQAFTCNLTSLNSSIVTVEKITKEVCAVQHCVAEDLVKKTALNFQVYETVFLEKLLKKIDFDDVSSLLMAFRRLPEVNDLRNVSLFWLI